MKNQKYNAAGKLSWTVQLQLSGLDATSSISRKDLLSTEAAALERKGLFRDMEEYK